MTPGPRFPVTPAVPAVPVGPVVPVVPVAVVQVVGPIVWWPLSGCWVMAIVEEGDTSYISLGPFHPLPPHHLGP